MKDVAFYKKNRIQNCVARIITSVRRGHPACRKPKKIGVKNQTIFYDANNECRCPVQMLAQIVTDIRKYFSDPNTMLCAHKNGNGMSHVASKDVNKILKDAARKTSIQKRRFPLSMMCPHSLRAGGAMSLKLANMDIVIIKTYGWWSSDTFLTHIHDQTSPLRHGVSKAMAQPRKFFNIVGYETWHVNE